MYYYYYQSAVWTNGTFVCAFGIRVLIGSFIVDARITANLLSAVMVAFFVIAFRAPYLSHSDSFDLVAKRSLMCECNCVCTNIFSTCINAATTTAVDIACARVFANFVPNIWSKF